MELFRAHQNWASRPADERFETLQGLHDAVSARDAASHDGELTLKHEGTAAAIEANGRFTLAEPGGGRFNLTNWSAGQLCSKLEIPRDFLGKVSPATRTQILSDRLALSGIESSRALLVPGVNGEAGTLRALHGERYGRVWDAEVTSALLSLLPSNWRNPVAYKDGEWGAELVPSGLYASDRDMFAFLIDGGDQLDLGGPDRFHRGFFISNSEVGAGSLWLQSFRFRVVCGNNIVWGASEVTNIRARHSGEMRPAVAAFKEFLYRLGDPSESADAAFARAVKEAKETFVLKLSDDNESQLAAERRFTKLGFTRGEVRGAIKGALAEEQGVTGSAWEWLQGFTSHARTLEHVDSRIALESRAAKALLVGAN